MLDAACWFAARSRCDDFSGTLANWWTEDGGCIAIEDGRLRMSADNLKIQGGGVATAWWKLPHAAGFDLTLDARVSSSSEDANNINLFPCYSDVAVDEAAFHIGGHGQGFGRGSREDGHPHRAVCVGIACQSASISISSRAPIHGSQLH